MDAALLKPSKHGVRDGDHGTYIRKSIVQPAQSTMKETQRRGISPLRPIKSPFLKYLLRPRTPNIGYDAATAAHSELAA
jgi:hypothetical protein